MSTFSRLFEPCSWLSRVSLRGTLPRLSLAEARGNSVRPALFSSRPIKPRFSVAHASASLSIGCLFPSVVSRIRLRLRGTLPHPRIHLSFFPCIIDASRPPNKETPYLFLSRDHKAAAAAARLRRERLVAVCVVCVLSSCVRDRTSFIRAHVLRRTPRGSHPHPSYIL